MNTSSEIFGFDAINLADLIRTKQLSPVEVIEAALTQISTYDSEFHAFCTLVPELARGAALRVEKSILAGDPQGPLAGLPVAIKDLVCTKGIRTTFGSKLYADYIPEEDDIAVERLTAAGAIVVGKTNVAELGYGAVGHNLLFPTTRNPWNPNLTSGGSSAGSAVAVATAMTPLAVGSDGGGSIRIPAALCGVVGMKASMGRVPLYPGCRDETLPGASGWESIEHIGPLAGTVRDAALMLSVMAGPDDRDRHSLPLADFDWLAVCEGDIKGLRVAYSPDWTGTPVDPEVVTIVASAAKVFESELGCNVEMVSPDFDKWAWAFLPLVMQETDLSGMRALIANRNTDISPSVLEMLKRPWSAEDLTDATIARKAVVNRMWRLMQRFDLLITPTVATAAFPVGLMGPKTINGRVVGAQDWTPFTWPMNFTGQPAVSIPVGFTETGLPVGLQIAGRHLDDAGVLRAAAAFEKVRPWQRWQGRSGHRVSGALSNAGFSSVE